MRPIKYDFEIQTDHLIPARRPLINKKKNHLSSNEFCRPRGSQRENEKSEKNGQILGMCQKIFLKNDTSV